ncbi:DUF4097 family beta strand repeat-containing protein [Paenibacillus tuaregi]|uniref:DUF4097 family beta strand repeat-containing protein n=1 Tax=Paenibacillus tuaregi TaxID=1816681 RepID=UPI0008387DA9|nr:DUF4097 family beta strand repeat-containing protein [Paenibacillus tuaregi]
MKKYAVVLAILLIIIGAGGMAAHKFAFGDELPSYSKKWTFEAGELKDLFVNSEHTIEAEFVESSDGTNYVEISGNLEQDTIDRVNQVKLSGGKLALDLSTKPEFRFFNFNFQSTRQHMTIALAQPSELEQIKFDLDSSSGEFKGLQAEQVEISSSSGHVDLDSVKARQLKVEIESGSITAGTIQADVDLSTQSGGVKIEHLDGNGSIKAESGSIRIADQNSTQLDLSAQSGSIKVKANPDFQGFYDAQADSGSVKIPDSPKTSSDVIKARTESGSIDIE